MSKSNIDSWLAYVKDGGVLPEKDVRILCEKVKEILVNESNVQHVNAPVTICGNISGMFYDLLHIFEIGGQIPDTRYVFMGGYSRAWNSVETIQLLLCLKLKYPGHITLLRGNNETRGLSAMYGLQDEILKKYGNINPWKYYTELFDYLGIAALIEGKIFCVHGGIANEIPTLDQIGLIERCMDVPFASQF